jgi:hypothetical protein
VTAAETEPVRLCYGCRRPIAGEPEWALGEPFHPACVAGGGRT